MQNAFSERLLEINSTTSSFFDVIDKIWEGENKHHKDPLHRIFSLMRKMKAKSYLLELLLLDNNELIEEKEMAEQRCKGSVHLKAQRIAFFSSFPKDNKWYDANCLSDKDVLGYAIIITLTLPDGKSRSYVSEAIICSPSIIIGDKHVPVTNYYIHNKRKFETIIGTCNQFRKFSIVGSFFTQQNNLTSVCAHAALRMAINSSPMFPNIKLTNKQINDILDIDFSSPDKYLGHYNDSDPSDARTGLTANEVKRVIETLGGQTIFADFQKDVSIEYDHFIYPIMESGCPVILALEGHDLQKQDGGFAHAIAIFGHTINSDRWGPEAHQGYRDFPPKDYILSSEWVDHLIMGDDNYGVYLSLPNEMIRNFIIPRLNPNLHATQAIGIIPQGIKVPGNEAEHVAIQKVKEIIITLSSHLTSPSKWLKRMQDSIHKITCRTFLISKLDYLINLTKLSRKESTLFPREIMNKFLNLPDYFWISEFSLPHLYSTNKHKLGDMLINANSPSDIPQFLLLWLPGIFVSSEDFVLREWPMSGHIPFFRLSNSEEENLFEW